VTEIFQRVNWRHDRLYEDAPTVPPGND
jgi:hypothetical protein